MMARPERLPYEIQLGTEQETGPEPGPMPEGYLDRDVIGYVTSAVHYALSTGQWRNLNLADLVRVAERGKEWAKTDQWV
jgi:hypothetical protein